MNIKAISIVLTCLLLGLVVMVIMVKGNYVDQATEHYKKTTDANFNGGKTIVDYMNKSVDVNKLAWAFACEAVQTVKTSQDMARLEGKYFPATKGTNNISKKTRTLEATADYVIVSTFDKDVMDKEAKIKILSGLKSIDVSTLKGEPLAVEEEEEVAEDEEEEVEEAPAPKKQAKAAKGKKGKKGKKR